MFSVFIAKPDPVSRRQYNRRVEFSRRMLSAHLPQAIKPVICLTFHRWMKPYLSVMRSVFCVRSAAYVYLSIYYNIKSRGGKQLSRKILGIFLFSSPCRIHYFAVHRTTLAQSAFFRIVFLYILLMFVKKNPREALHGWKDSPGSPVTICRRRRYTACLCPHLRIAAQWYSVGRIPLWGTPSSGTDCTDRPRKA